MSSYVPLYRRVIVNDQGQVQIAARSIHTKPLSGGMVRDPEPVPSREEVLAQLHTEIVQDLGAEDAATREFWIRAYGDAVLPPELRNLTGDGLCAAINCETNPVIRRALIHKLRANPQ